MTTADEPLSPPPPSHPAWRNPALAGTRPPLAITVIGDPAPQGSKRAFAVRGKGGVPTGRIAVIESSHDRVKSWRAAVIEAARDALIIEQLPGGARWRPPLDGPLEVVMVFTFRRPKSHYRTGRNSHLLKDSAPSRPIGQPDVAKIARSTEDALTSAGAWVDDARVVEYSRLAKVYAGPAGDGYVDPDALAVPGAVITVRQAT